MIRFFDEGIRFNLPRKRLIKKMLSEAIIAEGKKTGELSVIFCSDEYLLKINRQYLQHDYYTDIITFGYTEGHTISGDLFISINRVKVNAGTYNQTFEQELCRVMLHGLLHLCGYDDITPKQQKNMRAAEDRYLENAVI